MGYYSDVAIQCGEKAFQLLERAYKRKRMFPQEIYTDTSDASKIIKWNWIKWYDYFDDIQAIEKILELLNKERLIGKTEYAYKFIRVGEANGDVEQRMNEAGIEFQGLYPETQIRLPDEAEILKSEAV